jgi:hypothetical protein
MGIREYATLIWKSWPWVVGSLCAGGIIALTLTFSSQNGERQVYTASMSGVAIKSEGISELRGQLVEARNFKVMNEILVVRNESDTNPSTQTVAQIATSDLTLAPVAKASEIPIKELKWRVSTQILHGTDILRMSLLSPDAETAQILNVETLEELETQLERAYGSGSIDLVILESEVAAPSLSVNSSVQAESKLALEIAREIIAEDPSLAADILPFVRERFDQQAVAEMFAQLNISDDPKSLLRSFTFRSLHPTPQLTESSNKENGEFVIDVTYGDRRIAELMAVEAASYLKRTSGDDNLAGIKSPTLIMSGEVESTNYNEGRGAAETAVINAILGVVIGSLLGLAFAVVRVPSLNRNP